MSVTVNTFPPFQSMNSPRVWALAIITLLHLGFIWALSGLGPRIMTVLQPPLTVVDLPVERDPAEPASREPDKAPVDFNFDRTIIPEPQPVPVEPDAVDPAPAGGISGEVPIHRDGIKAATREPHVELPLIDPRMPLSEPVYPAAEIRLGHSGTVMLRVYVLTNGRIGEVRIEQSSGFPRLDMAAEREARRWHLKPGTQDGLPVAMWKTIPITFQLKK
jgi:periplasmic protein TonB